MPDSSETYRLHLHRMLGTFQDYHCNTYKHIYIYILNICTHKHTPFSSSTTVTQLAPWLSISSHPYRKHLHRTGQNSSHPQGTSGCTLLSSINHHPKGFWKQKFLQAGFPTKSNKALKALNICTYCKYSNINRTPQIIVTQATAKRKLVYLSILIHLRKHHDVKCHKHTDI